MSTVFSSLTSAAKWRAWWRLGRFHRPVGIYLLLWPSLSALWLASGTTPDPVLIGVFTLGTVLMRAAGCAVNDIFDRGFDPHVSRTASRPVASGELTVAEAAAMAVVLAAAAGALVLLYLNRLSVYLAVLALALSATYPLAKRWLPIPQLHLSLCFSFGVPMAFAAVGGYIPPHGWLLFAATALWVLAYDSAYALADAPEDQHLRLHSSAKFFGPHTVRFVGLCQSLSLVLLAVLGRWLHLAEPYWWGLMLALAVSVRVQWLLTQPGRAFEAFGRSHLLGLAVWLGLVIEDWWRQ